ncbi:MAG: Mur ligase family protein [Sphaerochaetaceae bacterium]|nr:Mur ligase family protein [Sphaerochaetaceae bacterium]MDD3163236.1 Mur ligase family protein [Sphaerochaetaceae bacterium]
MILVCILLAVLIILGIIECQMHRRNLDRISIRILVNGTRGKTSTARMLIAALNDQGIRTVGRTTGSEACVLFPDGRIEPVVRKRPARITEMIPFARLAVLQNAQCIVAECMALGAENQKAMARHLVRPTHVVITNSYVDHIDAIGSTFEETVWTLSQSVPRRCDLFASEQVYGALDSRFHLCCGLPSSGEGETLPFHPQNTALALAVIRSLGLDEQKARASMAHASGDIGLHKPFHFKSGALVVPDFAVNDLHCMNEALDSVESGARIILVFNNRKDREYRALVFSKLLCSTGRDVEMVCCIGDYPRKIARYLASRSHLRCEAMDVVQVFDQIEKSDSKTVFLCLGNIKGAGQQLLSRLEEA